LPFAFTWLLVGCGGNDLASPPPLKYSATQIIQVPPISFVAPSINNSGFVAGAMVNKSGVNLPFVWSAASGLIPLVISVGSGTSATLTGVSGAAAATSDNSGIVVGWIVGTNGNSGPSYTTGAVWNINTVDSGPALVSTAFGSATAVSDITFTSCELRGVDSSGNSVGWGLDESGMVHPFFGSVSGTGAQAIYSGTDLSPWIGPGYANAINDSMVVVGSSGTGQAFTLALPPPGGSVPNPTLLGKLPGQTTSTATAINAQGQVVGISGPQFGWNWTPSAPKDTSNAKLNRIGPNPAGYLVQSYAYGINSSGTIVGGASPPTGTTTSNGTDAAFIYTTKAGLQDLSLMTQGLPSGVSLTCATGINDNGQIVAIGTDSYAYLLSPLAPPKAHQRLATRN